MNKAGSETRSSHPPQTLLRLRHGAEEWAWLDGRDPDPAKLIGLGVQEHLQRCSRLGMLLLEAGAPECSQTLRLRGLGRAEPPPIAVSWAAQ